MTDPIGWTALACGAAVWAGVLLGGTAAGPWLAVTGLAVVVFVRGVRLLLVACLLAGMAAGVSQAWADAAVRDGLAGDPGGRVVVAGTLTADGRERPSPGVGWYAPLRPSARDGVAWGGPPLLVTTSDGAPAPAGALVEVRGFLRPGPVDVGGRPVAGVLYGEVALVDAPTGLLWLAEAIRDRVRATIDEGVDQPAAGLLVGFLLGDTAGLDPLVEEDLRDAGLAHYVAVSGSNVALYLMGWWVVTLPLATRPRARWWSGTAGLAVFVAVTRWEPSVVRASAMAALALAGRRFGLVLSARGLLGVAVAASLLVAPRFARSLGFQLSVAATLGLVLGAGGAGGRIARALRATIVAQVAVAPLLLATFGEVPVVSPLANLLAGPLVSAATVVGMVAAGLGVPSLAWPAGVLADLVIAIGRSAAPFPKVGWWGVGLAVALLAISRHRPLRRPVAVASVLVVVTVVLWPGPVRGPAVVFLDVGQGDAALVLGAGGEVVLVDGGPDPRRLADALHRYGVEHVDLLVVSHRHADHITGLAAVLGRVPVGGLWHPGHRESGALQGVLALADELGVPTRVPPVGTVARLGAIRLEVLGPIRRYASPNDESLVVRMGLAGTEVLFAGDIETFAQADLGPVLADVLKVPHQGAATSHPGWLAASVGTVAVISVGENDYGHPAEWVVETLETAGALVCRTDRDGDVVVVPGHVPACG